MKKLTMILVALVAATAVVVPGVVADADTVVECDGEFPYFDELAQSEEENQARIACVEERKDAIQAKIADGREKKADLTERIQDLKKRRAVVKRRIDGHRERVAPLNEALGLLRYIVGEVTWVYSTAFCESGGTMQRDIHSTSGTYHSYGQFSLDTWRSLQTAARYGPDPHAEVALVIARGMVELKHRDGDEQWPHCGD